MRVRQAVARTVIAIVVPNATVSVLVAMKPFATIALELVRRAVIDSVRAVYRAAMVAAYHFVKTV